LHYFFTGVVEITKPVENKNATEKNNDDKNNEADNDDLYKKAFYLLILIIIIIIMIIVVRYLILRFRRLEEVSMIDESHELTEMAASSETGRSTEERQNFESLLWRPLSTHHNTYVSTPGGAKPKG
jgi:flagellar biosynthesis/type III secretory pathway M-ring protein FliF/YscJ